METLLKVAAVAVPALVGAVFAYTVGHRSVRGLRQKTGDNSVLTNVLSGDAFRPSSHHKREAA